MLDWKTATVADAELAMSREPNSYGQAVIAATAEFDAARHDNPDYAILDGERIGFSRRTKDQPLAAGYLVMLEARDHFAKRRAEKEQKQHEERQRAFQRNNEARFAPLKAQMAATSEANRTAPLRALLTQITEATQAAKDALGAADVAAVAEVLETQLKDASAALRALRTPRKVA